MPTEHEVRNAAGGTPDFETAGTLLEIPPGRAYLIATGHPADSSTPGHDLGSRAQALVNPREVNPTSRGDVTAWIRRIAYSDGTMRNPPAPEGEPKADAAASAKANTKGNPRANAEAMPRDRS